MQTGRQTLNQIEGTISQLHDEETRIDGALRSIVAQQEQLRTQRSAALRELARVKLGEMAAGRLISNLDAAEQKALQIVAERKHRLNSIVERREAAITDAAVAERDQNAAGASVEQALAAVEAIRTAAEARVRSLPAWQSAKSTFDAITSVAQQAEEKAAQSEAELGAKKRPYDDDPLFVYLWTRNFGTQRYAAGNFTRMMDRIVADFISFPGARANYAMLVEIPSRLREHASGQKALAARAHESVAAIERGAMVADGVDDKERALTAARHKLAAAESTLEAKLGLLSALDKERDGLMSAGGESAYNDAIDTIAAGDAQDDLATLYREARRTPTLADENLVRRIEQIDSDLAKADKEAADFRRTAQDLARRRLEVEGARDNFRNAGYDHPHVTFGNDVDIGRVLSSILEGVVRSGILWDLIRGGFETRPRGGRPDFGSPSRPLPFPIPGGGDRGPSGGGWREPSSQGGWFPPASSSGGASKSDDDDFSTGGRF